MAGSGSTGIVLLLINTLFVVYGDVNVETYVGTIIGSRVATKVDGTEYAVKRFVGIPYGYPPTGERRFQKPEPLPSFDTPFEAAKFGNVCHQPDFPMMPAYQSKSEDCLYLNVYVPDQTPDKEAGHAVMVWIHGGGFNLGAGETYPGEDLCSFGNVILVTINYRLGIFGFMDSQDGTVPGNLGLHDQHLAFKWVNKNIGAFGGDNTRVTIFGESAGGSSVVFQALYPANDGLFQRVIAESGVPTANGMFTANPVGNILAVAKDLECDGTNVDEVIPCIKAANATKIMDALAAMMQDPAKAMSAQYLPTVDGEILKSKTGTLLSRSLTEELDEVNFFRSLGFISGFNNNEGGVFLLAPLLPMDDLETFNVTRENFITMAIPMAMNMAGQTSEAVKSIVIAEYTDWNDPNSIETNRDQYIRMMGDIYLTVGSVEMSRLHSNVSGTNQNSYAYLFSAEPTNHALKTASWFKGANHGDEVGYVFLYDERLVANLDVVGEFVPIPDWEYQLAYSMGRYWTNFAKSGDPNEPVKVPVAWPKYENGEQQYLNFDKDMSDNSIGKYLYAREANLWLETIPGLEKALSESHDHDASSPFVKTDSGSGSCSADGKCEVAEYELFYFDIRGRGQPIRYLLLDQGIKYKEVSVDPWDKWESTYKPIAPFGLCPFLIDGDFQLAESNAILRYLARKHGVHPEGTKEAATIDMINDNIEDVRKKYSDFIYSENYEADRDAFDKVLPDILTRWETQLNKEKFDYMLQKISFVDYNLFDMLDVLQLHSAGCLDKYPSLGAYYKRVADRPAIKAYRETAEFKRLKVNYNDYV